MPSERLENNKNFEIIPLSSRENSPQLFDIIETRIDLAQQGSYVNGHNPGTLPAEVKSGSKSAEQKFFEEYRWIAALGALVYAEKTGDPPEALMIPAEDALIGAIDTFNPEEEPNFVKHASKSVNSFIAEIFKTDDLEDPYDDPRVRELFTPFAEVDRHTSDLLLPGNRQPEDFFVGQSAFVNLLVSSAGDRQVTLGRVQSVKRYDHAIPGEPVTLRGNNSPGFMRIGVHNHPGVIIDVNHAGIVLPSQVKKLVRDEDYQEAWFSVGEPNWSSYDSREEFISQLRDKIHTLGSNAVESVNGSTHRPTGDFGMSIHRPLVSSGYAIA